jgi:hypothetical protein
MNEKEMYNLLFRVSKETVNEICKNKDHVGGTPGMISVLHTFGSDMKYHVHVHSLLTFGGIDEEGNWCSPKHKTRLCRNSKFRYTFKNLFLKGMKKLYKKGLIKFDKNYEEVTEAVKDSNWTIFVTHPTMKTETIELYVARYINKIAVSNSRLNYIKENEEVHLIYNDYKKQKAGEAAPKAIKKMHPLEFLNQLLQHLPPRYFQRIRRYGLHASSKKAIVKKTIEEKLKRHGRTVRTTLEIITDLRKNTPFVCEGCGGTAFKKEIVMPDKEMVKKWLTEPKIRSPEQANDIFRRRDKTVPLF